MTEQERIIVSAYTGYLMTDFDKVHKYVEEKLGRPIYTHEFAFEGVCREIEQAVKPEFLALCGKEE